MAEFLEDIGEDMIEIQPRPNLRNRFWRELNSYIA